MWKKINENDLPQKEVLAARFSNGKMIDYIRGNIYPDGDGFCCGSYGGYLDGVTHYLNPFDLPPPEDLSK